MSPPEVKCLTKLWHPNINEDGEICLSLLRQNSGMQQSKFHLCQKNQFFAKTFQFP